MSSQIFKTPLPYLALLIAHLIWGANFVVAKITLQEFPPMSLAFLRFAIASLFLAPFFLAETKKVKIDKKDLPKLISIGILIITLNITLFFEGIKKTTVIDASILSLTVPLLSVLFGWLFLREKIFLINLFGVGLGLFGALIIIGLPELLSGSFSTQSTIGNVLIILASISWVLGSIVAKPLLGKYGSLIVTAVAFIVGTTTFLIPAAIEYINNPSWPSQITILGLLGLAYMALLSSISAYFLFEWGLLKTSVYKANLLHYIEPLIAAFLAVLVLGENISSAFLIGGALIALSAYLGTVSKNKQNLPAGRQVHQHHHKFHRV